MGSPWWEESPLTVIERVFVAVVFQWPIELRDAVKGPSPAVRSTPGRQADQVFLFVGYTRAILACVAPSMLFDAVFIVDILGETAIVQLERY